MENKNFDKHSIKPKMWGDRRVQAAGLLGVVAVGVMVANQKKGNPPAKSDPDIDKKMDTLQKRITKSVSDSVSLG